MGGARGSVPCSYRATELRLERATRHSACSCRFLLAPCRGVRGILPCSYRPTKRRLARLSRHSACSYLFFFERRRVISLSLGLCAGLVRPSGLPHGLTGWRPPEVLPSPPPIGWSIGFIATPRTLGLRPFHRLRPALPSLMLPCSALLTSPTVARQAASTKRISPDGMRRWAFLPSLASNWTPDPADRAIFAPPPGRSSIACTTVPVGIDRSGRQLPALMSAPCPASTTSPWRRPEGARMYRFAPSA